MTTQAVIRLLGWKVCCRLPALFVSIRYLSKIITPQGGDAGGEFGLLCIVCSWPDFDY